MFRVILPAVFLLASAVHAQPLSPNSVYVAVGAGVPFGPEGLSEVRSWGPALDVGLDIPLEGKLVQVQFSAHRFAVDEAYYAREGERVRVSGGDALALSILAHVRVDLLKARTTPYVYGGVGGMIVQFSPYVVSRPSRRTEYAGYNDFAPALSVGAGFNVKLTETLDTYLGIGHAWGFTEGGTSSYLTPTLGLRIYSRR